MCIIVMEPPARSPCVLFHLCSRTKLLNEIMKEHARSLIKQITGSEMCEDIYMHRSQPLAVVGRKHPNICASQTQRSSAMISEMPYHTTSPDRRYSLITVLVIKVVDGVSDHRVHTYLGHERGLLMVAPQRGALRRRRHARHSRHPGPGHLPVPLHVLEHHREPLRRRLGGLLVPHAEPGHGRRPLSILSSSHAHRNNQDDTRHRQRSTPRLDKLYIYIYIYILADRPV